MAYLDVSGHWAMLQSNGLKVFTHIQQSGADITGSASYTTPDKDNGPLLVSTGGDDVRSMEARGTVTDREFQFAVSWNNGTRGLYRGVVDSDGTMTGTTRDAMDPSGRVETWRADRTFRLVPEPAPTQAPPIRAMGKPRTPKAPRVGAGGVDPGLLTDAATKVLRQPGITDGR